MVRNPYIRHDSDCAIDLPPPVLLYYIQFANTKDDNFYQVGKFPDVKPGHIGLNVGVIASSFSAAQFVSEYNIFLSFGSRVYLYYPVITFSIFTSLNR